MSNLKRNFAYNTLYQMLLIVLPLVLSPYVSRVLGAEGVGTYSYTYSIASGIAVFGMLGVNNYGNRSIAVVRESREKRSVEFWSIWIWQVMLTFAMVCIYMGYLVYLCKPQNRLISCIEILTILNSMLDINWFFFGMEKFKLTVTRNMVIKIISVLSVFLFVKTSEDTWIYALIIIGSTVISNLILWTFLKKYVDYRKPEWKKVKSHFTHLLILFIPVIAVSIYQKMDKIMLGSFSNMQQSGYYENVEKVINIPKGVITAMGTVMLPRMSYLMARHETEQVKKYIDISMEFVMFSSSAMAFGIAAVANDFVPLFFGEDFRSIGPLVQFMAVTVIFVSCANVVRTQYLIPGCRDKIYIKSVWLGAAINFITNLLFIPRFGAMGAVAGTVAAEGSVMLYQMLGIVHELNFFRYFKKGSYYLLCGLMMYIGVTLISRKFSGMLNDFYVIMVEILAGAVIYALMCFPYIWIVHGKKIFERKHSDGK